MPKLDKYGLKNVSVQWSDYNGKTIYIEKALQNRSERFGTSYRIFFRAEKGKGDLVNLVSFAGNVNWMLDELHDRLNGVLAWPSVDPLEVKVTIEGKNVNIE